MRISQRYLDFDTQLSSMVSYLDADTATRLGVPTEQITELTALNTAWGTALAAYIDPATHTPAAVQAMRENYDETHTFIIALRQQVKNNAAVTLTPDDYQNLYIHIDKTTRTRINPPTFAPVVTLLGTWRLVNEFDASMPTSETINHLALPAHMKVGRKIAVVADGTEPTEDDYHSIDNVGRTKFKLTFAPAEAGMNGYLICAYYNPRGEHGPESPALKFQII